MRTKKTKDTVETMPAEASALLSPKPVKRTVRRRTKKAEKTALEEVTETAEKTASELAAEIEAKKAAGTSSAKSKRKTKKTAAETEIKKETDPDMLYDRDIREPLFEFLEDNFQKVRILEEKSLLKARADVIMVLEDRLAGIEIKSDADSYARLSGQVKDYDLFFDCNYVVVGSSHAAHIEEHVPEHWGLITVEKVGENVDFYMLRKAGANPNLDWKYKISLLWRPELAHIQEINGMHAYKNKSKAFVREKILETVPAELLGRQFSEELFERDYSSIKEIINQFRKENGKKPRRKRRIRRRIKKV